MKLRGQGEWKVDGKSLHGLQTPRKQLAFRGTFPVVLGRGKRLFENGARPCALRLVASKVSTIGVVMSTYVPAGDIPLVSLSQAEPGAKELTRRAKMATDAT